MRWLVGHSEWRLLVGVVPALLAVVTVELLVGPEVVELLVGQLVQGVDAEPRFARGMIMMSALTVSYVALCLALLAYYCSAVGASPLPAGRKRRLAVAGTTPLLRASGSSTCSSIPSRTTRSCGSTSKRAAPWRRP